MVTSLTLACFTTLFIYTLYLHVRAEDYEQSRLLRNYELSLQSGLDGENLARLLADDMLAELDAIELTGVPQNRPFKILGVKEQTVFGGQGEKILPRHSEERQCVSVVSSGANIAENVGETWTFCGQEFAIIGICQWDIPEVWIPYSIFLELAGEITITNASLCFPKILSDAQEAQFYALAERYLPEAEISHTKVHPEAIYTSITALALIAALFILAIINVVTLFRYWIEANRQQFMVYKLTGCPSKKMIFKSQSPISLYQSIDFLLSLTRVQNHFWTVYPLQKQYQHINQYPNIIAKPLKLTTKVKIHAKQQIFLLNAANLLSLPLRHTTKIPQYILHGHL